MPEYLILPAIVCVFIVLDIVTGLIQAIANKCVDSSKLRQGAFHKFAYIFLMVLAYIIDFTMGYYDMGFAFPLLDPVCVYLVLTEVVSILENITKLNPALKGTGILNIFKNSKNLPAEETATKE